MAAVLFLEPSLLGYRQVLCRVRGWPTGMAPVCTVEATTLENLAEAEGPKKCGEHGVITTAHEGHAGDA